MYNKNLIKSALLGICLSVGAVSHADTVTLAESQKDEVKCGPVIKDPDTGESYQDCYQNTTGAYSATIKLSEATFANNQSLFTDIDADTSFGLTIGEFSFQDTLSAANIKKLTKNTAEGTWKQSHEVCLDEDCEKSKQVVDGTVKFIRTKNKGAIITLSGKSDNDLNGQKIFSSLCSENGTGVTYEDAVFTIGGTDINASLQITCTVRSSTADEDGNKGGPYDLTNMTIKAKLAPNTCSF